MDRALLGPAAAGPAWPRPHPRLAACAAALALAGCGPQVDSAVPVPTTLSRAGLAAKPLARCVTPAPRPADPVTGLPPGIPPVTVVGDGFLPQVFDVTADNPRVVQPVVSLHGPTDYTFPVQFAFFRGSSAIDLNVPSTLPVGLYDVTVRNPEGTTGTLAQALQIIPPPSVQSVSPASICAGQVQRIVLTGGLFIASVPPAAAVAGVALPAGSVTVDSASQVTVTVPANTIGAGATSAAIQLTDVDGCVLSPSPAIPVGSTCAP